MPFTNPWNPVTTDRFELFRQAAANAEFRASMVASQVTVYNYEPSCDHWVKAYATEAFHEAGIALRLLEELAAGLR